MFIKLYWTGLVAWLFLGLVANVLRKFVDDSKDAYDFFLVIAGIFGIFFLICTPYVIVRWLWLMM